MYREPPVAVTSATGGVVWTTSVHNGRNDDRAFVVWRTDTFDPRLYPAHLEYVYRLLERQLALKIGEPVPDSSRDELLDALKREAEQYGIPPMADERLAHLLAERFPQYRTVGGAQYRPEEGAVDVALRILGDLADARDLADEHSLAPLAYGAYASVSAWNLPDWKDLPETVKEAWRTSAVASFVRGVEWARTDAHEKADPAVQRELDATRARAVFEALGEASVAWEHIERAGVFDSTRAARIGTELLVRLGFTVPEGYPPEVVPEP
jgi:hypothetical protein